MAEEHIYNVRKIKKEANDTRLKHNYEKYSKKILV